MELLFLRVAPLHINEESPALFSLIVHFQTRFNETKMGKEWDLPRGKLAHCPHLKVQGVSVTKSLSELFILIL